MYEPTRPETLSNLEAWLQLFRDSQSPGARAVLVGTKMDLVEGNNPLREKAELLGQREGMAVWEVSAKTGSGVAKLFAATVAELAQAGQEKGDPEVDRVVAKLSAVDDRKRTCCNI